MTKLKEKEAVWIETGLEVMVSENAGFINVRAKEGKFAQSIKISEKDKYLKFGKESKTGGDPLALLMKKTKDELIVVATEKELSKDNDLASLNKTQLADLILSVKEGE